MSERKAAGIAWGLSALTFLLLLSGAGAVWQSGGQWSVTTAFSWLTAIPCIVVGSLIATRQPANAIGWIFLSVAVATGLGVASHGYAWYWISGHGGPEFLGETAAWYGELSWILFILLPPTFLLLLFPDGNLPSPRWRIIARCAALGIGGSFLTAGLAPGRLADFPQVENPYGWSHPALDPLTGLAFLFLLIGMVGSSASLIVRFRRAEGDQRLQIKWLALAGAIAAVTIIVGIAGYEVWGENISNSAIMLSIVGLPIASGIAILKHRLYDVDVVINRTLVYGVLTAILAAAYLALVVLFQGLLSFATQESDIAVAGSTLAVAALFRPVRARVQSFIDRRFYRSRYDAHSTLERFTARLRDEVDLDSLSSDLVATASETMQPSHASLWLKSRLTDVSKAGTP